jgi:ADP-ribose pyrophosphatase YjhB (NUDIX family)
LSAVSDPRAFPDRPFLAVSAAIVRDGKVLIVRRARPPAKDVYTLPGGVVEAGETLTEAVAREIREETALTIEPVALAGHREAIKRSADGRVERHFVILCFAARLISGTAIAKDDEVAEILWCRPGELAGLHTTEGLAEIVGAAFTLLGETP